MISIVRRFAGDQRGFCASEYALAAVMGVTIAIWGACHLEAKTAEAFAATHTSFLDLVKESRGSAACRV